MVRIGVAVALDCNSGIGVVAGVGRGMRVGEDVSTMARSFFGRLLEVDLPRLGNIVTAMSPPTIIKRIPVNTPVRTNGQRRALLSSLTVPRTIVGESGSPR